jgi:hypothetical protein
MTSGNTSPECECEKFKQTGKEEHAVRFACKIVVNDSGNTAEQLESKIVMLNVVKIEKVEWPNFDEIFIRFHHKRCC